MSMDTSPVTLAAEAALAMADVRVGQLLEGM
jgi:hypothetical protein